jgi:hypothetical protein
MTPIDFAHALLRRLGLPETENNIAALVGVQVQEGGHSGNSARFNPMNVTQPAPGSKLAPGFSAKGPQIQTYPDWNTGVEATAKLLSNGLYKGVLASLARSAPPSETLREIAFSPYGWYEMRGGKRVPLPYPLATNAAAAWKSYGSKLFPDLGGVFDAGSRAARDVFTSRPIEYGMALYASALAVGALGLVVYALSKKGARRGRRERFEHD